MMKGLVCDAQLDFSDLYIEKNPIFYYSIRFESVNSPRWIFFLAEISGEWLCIYQLRGTSVAKEGMASTRGLSFWHNIVGASPPRGYMLT